VAASHDPLFTGNCCVIAVVDGFQKRCCYTTEVYVTSITTAVSLRHVNVSVVYDDY
jgi:hypothetical protein